MFLIYKEIQMGSSAKSYMRKGFPNIRGNASVSRIPDPDFYPSRIPDPKTATKERGDKKMYCHTFSCSHKFHKTENYFSFEVLKKKIWPNFQRIIELFSQKFVTKLSKIWV
jgi:hypothetical protein